MCVLSCVQLFVIPWTVVHQAPLSLGFTGVGCHFLLQRIFLTQGSNLRLLCLLHLQADSLPLSHRGSQNAEGAFRFVNVQTSCQDNRIRGVSGSQAELRGL